jgi:hypothetical protein
VPPFRYSEPRSAKIEFIYLVPQRVPRDTKQDGGASLIPLGSFERLYQQVRLGFSGLTSNFSSAAAGSAQPAEDRHALARTTIEAALGYRQFYLAILYFRSPAAFLDKSAGSICTRTSVTRG